MKNRLGIEESYNVYTHFIGILLSFVGILWLFFNVQFSSTRAFVGVAVYGFSLLFLFSASTIYHWSKQHQRLFWQKIDHIGIFILIAGTYTPVTLITLYPHSGLPLFIAVWSIAFFGFLFKLFYIGRYERLSLFLYLAMGWLVVFAAKDVYALFSKEALTFLISGGIFYNVGVVFYRWHSLKFHHAIWHVFVLLGAISHFLMIQLLLAS